ncbi:MAG: hypothetical protein DHS20C10_00010 [marine bacterium B5-7]|nr:MAG: hypothetical protein DHS20C10_00010 [marine bacterium B5-7]
MTPNGSIDEQMAAFATKSKRPTQSLEHASRALAVSQGIHKVVKFSKLFFKFLGAVVHPIAQSLRGVMHALPPIHLALLSINAVWDMAITLTFGRESNLHKAIKSGVAITSVALTTVSLVFPATAIILATIGVGLTLVKEFSRLHKRRKQYVHRKNSLVERRLALEAAQVERLHPRIMRKLQAQITVLEKQTELAKRTYRASWLQLSLMTFTVAGTICLFFPPIAPIGLGLLTASIIAGVGVQLSNWILPKLLGGKPLLPRKQKVDGDPGYLPAANSGMTVAPETHPQEDSTSFEETPTPDTVLKINPEPLVTEDSTEDFLDVENFARAVSPQAKLLHQEDKDDQDDDDDEGEGESQPTDSIEPKLTP